MLRKIFAQMLLDDLQLIERAALQIVRKASPPYLVYALKHLLKITK